MKRDPNVVVLGTVGACTHTRAEWLQAMKQLLTFCEDVGPAMVAVVLTDEFEGDQEVSKEFIRGALLQALKKVI